MPYAECVSCGARFRVTKTSEQRLLSAIYGDKQLCPKCLKDQSWPKCTTCEKPVENPVLFNNEPYHSYCLPFSEEE